MTNSTSHYYISFYTRYLRSQVSEKVILSCTDFLKWDVDKMTAPKLRSHLIPSHEMRWESHEMVNYLILLLHSEKQYYLDQITHQIDWKFNRTRKIYQFSRLFWSLRYVFRSFHYTKISASSHSKKFQKMARTQLADLWKYRMRLSRARNTRASSQ